jgi:hypothetical protein
MGVDEERLKQIMDDQLVTAASAAHVRGVDRRTIQQWFEKGALKATTTTHDGRPLFRRGDVLRCVPPPRRAPRKNSTTPPAPAPPEAEPQTERTNQ